MHCTVLRPIDLVSLTPLFIRLHEAIGAIVFYALNSISTNEISEFSESVSNH